jgi:ectoine hydroxylase-related dioxygenase (phytanoyl-CoA dioxygenase family)
LLAQFLSQNADKWTVHLPPGVRLIYARALFALPGCPMQPIHRDAPPGGMKYNVLIPLTNHANGMGHTELWLGTHKDPKICPGDVENKPSVYYEPNVGDALMFEQSVYHRGTPNDSYEERVVLLLLYTKDADDDPSYYQRTCVLDDDIIRMWRGDPQSGLKRPRRSNTVY